MHSHDTFNAALMANPNWREVKKKKWVDRQNPFRVSKADQNIICNRSPKSIMVRDSKDGKGYKSSDPYTDKAAIKLPRGPDERLVLDKR